MPKRDESPEFRKDLVSGDWILVASGRRKRPMLTKKSVVAAKKDDGKENCPFEDPQKAGNPAPLLWHPRPGKRDSANLEDLSSWFIQVIPNKFPLFFHQKSCPEMRKKGDAEFRLPAVGYHEVIITRDHNKTLDKMTLEEVDLVLKTYQERHLTLLKDPCVKYVLILHNQGEAAGASVPHPHSQIMALTIIDPDISSSLSGSWNYYKVYRKCVHCTMLEHELKEKVRIVKKNKHFVTVVPFAPRVSYETRIYPLVHSSKFQEITDEQRKALAESLKDALTRINKAMDNPDYNFFIHTAPVDDGDSDHYHWHLEILPRGFKWAGLELGMGIEVVAVPPEEAAMNLRKQIK